MKAKPSQGRRLIAILKRKACTHMEMQRLGISTSPHKRVVECLDHHEFIVKAKRGSLLTWKVVTATRWTA